MYDTKIKFDIEFDYDDHMYGIDVIWCTYNKNDWRDNDCEYELYMISEGGKNCRMLDDYKMAHGNHRELIDHATELVFDREHEGYCYV